MLRLVKLGKQVVTVKIVDEVFRFKHETQSKLC